MCARTAISFSKDAGEAAVGGHSKPAYGVSSDGLKRAAASLAPPGARTACPMPARSALVLLPPSRRSLALCSLDNFQAGADYLRTIATKALECQLTSSPHNLARNHEEELRGRCASSTTSCRRVLCERQAKLQQVGRR
jgi:hypothetical protein